MSTEAETEGDLRQRIGNFLQRNFPQIQMHGGDHAIKDLNEETGEVTIMLSGTCSGCGISPMTIQAIKSRMVQEIPEINMVYAETGTMSGHPIGGQEDSGMQPSFPNMGSDDDENDGKSSAPF